MPSADGDVTVLVCDGCGKTLRAPGARPGRVGKCPACGSILRFPGEEARPAPRERPRVAVIPPAAEAAKPPATKRKTKARPIPPAIPVGASGPGGPEVDEAVLPQRATILDPERREALRDAARQVGRGGILKLPRRSSFGLRDALLYPIWDFAGISWILFLPITLGLPFLGVFFLIPVVLQGGNMAILGPFAFPMVVVFAFALGYFGLVLEAVITDSAAGEVHHPKWPDIEFVGIITALFRWAIGLSIGLGLGAVPAIRFWRRSEQHGPADRVVVAGLLATGLIYGLMSMAALTLHGDLMAANPVIVLKGVFRAGVRYGQTILLAIAFMMLGALGLEGIDRASGSFLILPMTYLAWAVIVYGALGVCRSLGMVCRARQKEIGWFPERVRWGASTDGIDPSLFRDKEGRRVE